ncbi:MAG: AAA family ATPase, partial [Phycisphaerales bacterium]|nr:AAA family ATPase [Phycisphaerales bacterium]
MRLSKITLTGFKSFADQTEFAFDEAITGIVGPNGCGKSNVVDGIKWVLGERSAKSLRGDAMLDVIFAGSSVRKPVGSATVTLTFENPVVRPDAQLPSERRALPVDASEVDVARRLYRDGRSEYLINNRKCRLRDIRELFMDTGIGTHAYSIIEQGKVDAMLLANPSERRLIFEEAAGIARFKARRIEATRKLERTEANLIRVREQLAQTDRRLRIVRGQAAKARKFQDLAGRAGSLQVDVALDTYHELVGMLEARTREITALESRRQALATALREAEDAKQQADITRHERLQDQRRLEQRRLEQTAARKQAEQRHELTARNIADAEQQVTDDATRIDEIGARLDQLRDEAAAADQRIVEMDAHVATLERTVSALARERAGIDDTLVEGRRTLREHQDRVTALDRERSQLDTRAAAIDERRERLDVQRRRVAERREAIVGEREGAADAQRTADRARAEAATRVEALEHRLAEHDRDVASLGDRQATLSEQVSDARHERASLASRRHLLEEMQQAREGLGDAVKTVLEDADRFPGVRGLLADAIDADREHARIVECALGPSIESLLVDRLDDLR